MSGEPVLPSSSLCGSEGELVSVSILVEPRLLEDLLDALAGISFPINPSIRHAMPQTEVEFPAYNGRLEEVRETLRRHGFAPEAVQVHDMLSSLAS